MEKQISTWNKTEDDKYHLLQDVWRETPLAVQRKFLFDFIDSNFHLYDDVSKNINPFKPCEGCADKDKMDKCIGCEF